IINPNGKGYKLIDLTGLSATEKEIVRAKHRPHDYPTVYMSDNKIEPNALFIEIIPTDLNTIDFKEESID
ncbi:MAG: hypothetical protein ACK5XN_32365, partial [Bacteroidota bacterium]